MLPQSSFGVVSLGIGLATAKKLAQTPGHLCILTSREPAKGAQALKEMQQEGMDAVCKQLDISGGSSVEVSATVQTKHVRLTHGDGDLRGASLAPGPDAPSLSSQPVMPSTGQP